MLNQSWRIRFFLRCAITRKGQWKCLRRSNTAILPKYKWNKATLLSSLLILVRSPYKRGLKLGAGVRRYWKLFWNIDICLPLPPPPTPSAQAKESIKRRRQTIPLQHLQWWCCGAAGLILLPKASPLLTSSSRGIIRERQKQRGGVSRSPQQEHPSVHLKGANVFCFLSSFPLLPPAQPPLPVISLRCPRFIWVIRIGKPAPAITVLAKSREMTGKGGWAGGGGVRRTENKIHRAEGCFYWGDLGTSPPPTQT